MTFGPLEDDEITPILNEEGVPSGVAIDNPVDEIKTVKVTPTDGAIVLSTPVSPDVSFRNIQTELSKAVT